MRDRVLGVVEETTEPSVTSSELLAATLLDDPSGVHHGDALGAFGRPHPVGDDDAGPPLQETRRGGDHPLLGHRVHPRGRLVEHDHAHVAHQQAGERHELFLAGREHGARRTQERVEPVGEPGDPVGESELVDRLLDPRPRRVAEQRDVLGERARDDLRALGHRADGGPECVEVEVEHVDSPDEDRAGRRIDGPRQQRRQRRLARSAAADESARGPVGDGEVDVAECEVTLGVRERQVTELDVERTVGEGRPSRRFGLRLDQGAQAHEGAEAGLEIRELVGDAVDLAHERHGDGEERHQRRRRLSAGDDDEDAADGDDRQETVQEETRTSDHHRLEHHHPPELLVDVGGEFGDATDQVGLSEARAQVVTCGDALLGRRGVVGPGGLLDHAELTDAAHGRSDGDEHRAGGEREQHERRPPGEPGDEQEGDADEEETHHAPGAVTQQRADLVGVVVDAIQGLAHRLLAQRTQRLMHDRGEEVGAQSSLRPVDDGAPDDPGDGVEHGGADDEHGEEGDAGGGRGVGETTDDDRPERLADGGDRGDPDGHARRTATETASVDRALGRRYGRVGDRRRRGRVVRSRGHRAHGINLRRRPIGSSGGFGGRRSVAGRLVALACVEPTSAVSRTRVQSGAIRGSVGAWSTWTSQ